MAAAASGITTILDMPNTLPPTTNLQRLDEKRRLAKKKHC
jgi:dihydroorotase